MYNGNHNDEEQSPRNNDDHQPQHHHDEQHEHEQPLVPHGCHNQCTGQIASGPRGDSSPPSTSSSSHSADRSAKTTATEAVASNKTVSNISEAAAHSAQIAVPSTSSSTSGDSSNDPSSTSSDRPIIKVKRPVAQPYKNIRAGPSTMYSFIRFVNRTKRSIDVVWVNYEGIGVHYRSLKPGHSVDVNTFVGHPWIFCDSDTGDRLVVDNKEVFEPVGWDPQDGWPPTRKKITITQPSKLQVIVHHNCFNYAQAILWSIYAIKIN